ncbi:MAG: amino acid/amide transporter substrate-binding protein family [Candidatus Taylorbacteria bacterium]|nr:amino acid/amide transporter substrate-binding protein family [Candidatus Taylorbacteria bacterium]
MVAIAALLLAVSKGFSHPPKQIRLGLMVPLSGNSASVGERIRNGAQIAVADLERNGQHISLIIEDDKGDSPTAVSVANKLISSDRVRIIIGTAKSDPMLAIAPITEKNKIILISPTAGADAISSAGDYVFRTIELADGHGKAAAEFFSLKNIRTAGMFVANASNAQSYGNAFVRHFSETGTLTATSTYNPADADFRTIISKIISTHPQAMYLGVATAKDAGLIVKQSRELGYAGPIVASVAAFAPEFITTAGSAAEGAYVNAPSFDASVSPALEFNQKYRTRFGADSDGFAANSYDAIMLAARAIHSCGGDSNTDCIRDTLYQTKDYRGVSGTMTFDRNGDVAKPVAIKRVAGGKFVDAQ